MSKRALVTGGTSGIGRSTALALAVAGWEVTTFSRRGEGPEGIRHWSVGLSYQAVCLLAKVLPARLLNAIIYRIYGA